MSTERSLADPLANRLVAVRAPRISRRRLSDGLAPYLFISPFVVSFLVLFVGSAVYSFWLSFHRFKGYGEAKFIGLNNYLATLNYHVFWTMVGNTVFYWLAHVLPMMTIAFLLAILVRSRLVRAKGLVKPIIFMPNIVAIVAASLVFQNLFGTQYGVINAILGTQIAWLQDPTLAKLVVVILLIWKNVGFWFVVFLAGLTSTNPDVEDAARIDGASGWQRLRHVTIPLLRPIFLFAFVIDAIGSFQIFTEPNVLMARGGSLAPPETAPLLNLLVTNLGAGNFGQASAVSWILFLIVAVASLVQYRLFSAETKGRPQ
jgi:ABC-type sugar transport system permease subunit